MPQADLRTEMRVPITRRGTLGSTSSWFPCLIQDCSTQGFQIMSTTKLSVGDVVELRSELYPQRMFHCKVEVRHFNDMCLGTRIVDVSDEGRMLCRQFVDEQVSLARFK